MNTLYHQDWFNSDVLVFEIRVIAYCLVVAFCLATLSNLFGRRKQPEAWSTVYLPAVAGAAVAVLLTLDKVTHAELPNWMFFINILIGLGVGLAAYSFAPSGNRMRHLIRRWSSAGPAPGPEIDPEPAVRVGQLPGKARPSSGKKYRELEEQRAAQAAAAAAAGEPEAEAEPDPARPLKPSRKSLPKEKA